MDNAIWYQGVYIWPVWVGEGWRGVITDRFGGELHETDCDYGSRDEAIRTAKEWIDRNVHI